jgi:V/A-type H+-transporting ATPase subunit C
MSSKVSMPSKIFGTVLSHGLRGRMLTKGELQTLAESRDMEELVTRTKNTVYLDALAKLTKPYTAEKVEGALREYMVNMHAKMVTIAGGSTILDAYFVKYITMDLKLVLKGKALGKTYEELLPKINLRAEELVGRRDLVIKALVAKDLDEAVALQEVNLAKMQPRQWQPTRKRGMSDYLTLFLITHSTTPLIGHWQPTRSRKT